MPACLERCGRTVIAERCLGHVVHHSHMALVTWFQLNNSVYLLHESDVNIYFLGLPYKLALDFQILQSSTEVHTFNPLPEAGGFL